MSYKIDNFLVNVSPTDTKLHIRDGYGVVRWTVDAYDITTSFVNNNLLNIKLKSTDSIIILDFLSKYDAKSALKSLQEQLDTLRVKTPINVDPQLVKYIDSRQLSGPTGPQGPIGPTGPQGPIGYNGNFTTLYTDSSLVSVDTPSQFTFATSSSSTDSVYTTESFGDLLGWYFQFTSVKPTSFNELNLTIQDSEIYRIKLTSGGYQIWTVSGKAYQDSYNSGDIFSVYSDGVNVYFYKNNSFIVSLSYVSGNYKFLAYPNTLDNPSGTNNASYTISGFKFYPTGKNGSIGINGATGSTGATGSADRYTGTSSTPLQVPTINEYVTFQTQPDLSFTVLQDVLAVGLTAAYVFEYVDDYVEGDTAKYFIGQVDSYNSTTGDLNLIVTYQQGYGLTDSNGVVPTYSFWYLNLSGKPGESLSINTPFNNAILTSDGTPTGVNVNQGLLFDGLTFSVYGDVVNYQRTHFQQVSETVYFTDGTDVILSSGTASYNLLTNNSAIWYHYQLNDQFPAGTPGTYVAAFSNVPTDKDGCVTLTITIDQTLDNGNTSYYYPSSVVINGTPYAIYWANGVEPSPALGNVDVFGFTVFIKSGLIIKVIGQSSTFATL